MKREFLKGLGLEPEAIEKIMADYGSSVESLKNKNEALQAKVDDYNTKTLKISDLEKELKTIKGKSGESDAWKEKAESLESEFQKYKDEQEQKFNEMVKQTELENQKRFDHEQITEALTKLHAHADLLSLLTDKVDREKIQRGEDGKITNIDDLLKPIQEKHGAAFGKVETRTPPIADPPTNHSTNFTIEDVKKMTPDQINKNWDSVKKVINKE